jgi:DNA relaxase NicK
MNFDKVNKLKSKNNFTIKNDYTGEITYRLFGNKQTSTEFIRYYDKKLDLADTEAERLYPDYLKEKTVMRYELQVKSDGIHIEDKEKRVDELKYIAHL